MNIPVLRFSIIMAIGWATVALLPAQTPAPSGAPGANVLTPGVTPPPPPAGARPSMGPRLDIPAPSPQCTLVQTIGNTKVTIVYCRPDVKGRKIFGGLEPYGKVWRVGANSETTLEFSTDVKLNGNPVPAGKYGIFAIPGPDKWTIIIDKNSKMWGAFTYDPKDDLVRFDVAPATLPTPVETFGIEIKDIHDDSAVMNLLWETTRVPITVNTGAVDKVLAEIDAAVASSDPKPTFFYTRAASFYNDHYEDRHLDLSKALDWVNQAIANTAPGSQGYSTIYTTILLKARIQAKLGDTAGARANAQKALDMAKADKGMEGIEYTNVAGYFLSALPQ